MNSIVNPSFESDTDSLVSSSFIRLKKKQLNSLEIWAVRDGEKRDERKKSSNNKS